MRKIKVKVLRPHLGGIDGRVGDIIRVHEDVARAWGPDYLLPLQPLAERRPPADQAEADTGEDSAATLKPKD